MQTIFVDPDLCVACKSCEIACAVNRSSLSKRLPEAMFESPSPLSRVRVEETGTDCGFPIQCRHCEDAPCLDACPAKALYRDDEGLVLLHDERCIGCWMCVMVCPFGAPQPFRNIRKMLKCDRCVGMDAPFCVESCPTKALVLLDPEAIARGAVKLRRGAMKGLDFLTGRGLTKA
ncbi:MAG TPA: 4Fe-4S dicluster domain-containing protein [Candidatus Baltobacteraceae bacterium]|nr:4Fe-4S dicluster domain-containing protein [Candidatus Baltobacteraceae bacterium]